MDKNEFDVLTLLEKENRRMTQREISEILNFSLGKVNGIFNSLVDNGLILDGVITKKGLKELEPYRVKRAIFFAAGFGSRLVPITLKTPKPLISVNGKVILENLIESVIDIGIKDIIIVRGYLAEKFDYLKNKYPIIKFIDNVNYNESNNISSAFVVRNKLSNTYVFESDLVLNRKNLVTKYQYSTNVLGFKAKYIDDWCLITNKDKRVIDYHLGGVDGYQIIGIYYIDRISGEKLKKDIKEVYNSPGGKERLWEEVLFIYKKNNYFVNVRVCNKNDVKEIDSYKDYIEIKKINKKRDKNGL